jgi:hemoglobin
MTARRVLSILAAVFTLIIAGGCSRMHHESKEKATVTPPPVNDLYHRMGEAKLKAVINDMVDASANDPKVALERAGQANHWSATPQSIANFKKGLFTFIAASTGGPQKYKGPDMVTAHKGMNITDAQFDAMLSHLQAAMDKNNVGPNEQRDLVQIFNGTRQSIVQQPK